MNPRTRISQHFNYSEFFSRSMCNSYSEAFLKRLLDPRVVPIMEQLRSSLGRPIYINNWLWGGRSQSRGFRAFTSSVGARYSQHKFGRAVDFSVGGMSANQVRQHILDNEQLYMSMGVSRLEDGRVATTWIHFDVSWTGLDRIYVFRD